MDTLMLQLSCKSRREPADIPMGMGAAICFYIADAKSNLVTLELP